MRLVQIIAGLVIGLAVAMGGADARDWKTIRIGTEGAYPPFNDVDSTDQPVGFDIDIARALCNKMQATCTFEVEDWDDIIPSLNADKFDAVVSSMPVTDERRQRVAFTNKYYARPSSFMAPKDSKIASFDAAGFKGKVIGVQSSTSQAQFLQSEIQPAGAQIKLYDTQDEANTDLATGRLDAVLADKIVLKNWLGKPESSCCEIKADVDLAKNARYFGEGEAIAVRKSNPDLVEKFNKAIADIIADGTYKKINDKYFPFSIY